MFVCTRIGDLDRFGNVGSSRSTFSMELDGFVDRTLVVIFRDLKSFTGLVNAAISTNQPLGDAEFENSICCFQYRLLQLQGTLNHDILSECLRLAMLAFLTTACRIVGHRPQYPYVASRFRHCCCAIDTKILMLQIPRDLSLWLLTVGVMSVWDVDEPWLRKRWQVDVSADLEWPEARRRLQEILWIDAMHDRPGTNSFEAMQDVEVDEHVLSDQFNVQNVKHDWEVWRSSWHVDTPDRQFQGLLQRHSLQLLNRT